MPDDEKVTEPVETDNDARPEDGCQDDVSQSPDAAYDDEEAADADI